MARLSRHVLGMVVGVAFQLGFFSGQTKLKFLLTAMGAVLTATLIAPPAGAVPYDVDTTLSSVTFTALLGTAPLTPQSVGADVSFFGGTVEATVPLGGGLLTLGSSGGFGTSFIPGLENAAPAFLPMIGGVLAAGDDQVFADGTEDPSEDGDGVFSGAGISAATGLPIAENYGFELIALGATLAVRDLALTAEGSGMTGGAATSIGWNFASGFLGVDGLGFLTDVYIGQDATNSEVLNAGGVIGYSLVGTTETITLPVDITIVEGANTFILAGSIVASRVIPEPATLALFGIGLFSSLLVRRR